MIHISKLRVPKKYIPWVIIGVLVIGGIAMSAFGKGEKDSRYESIIAKRRDVMEETIVTGRVTPADRVDLSFEQSGRIVSLFATVGNQVKKSALLAVLNNANLMAELTNAQAGIESAEGMLAQYQAAREREKVKLKELELGIRKEEITIAETSVANAKKTRADAEATLDDAKKKGDVDLANVYGDVSDILQDVFTKIDDAQNKQIDELFIDDNGSNPQIAFSIPNFQLEFDTEYQRLLARNALQKLKNSVDTLPSDYPGIDVAFIAVEKQLVVIRTFFEKLTEAVAAANAASYKSTVNTARGVINTQISAINNQKQFIVAQKATNAQSILAAQAQLTEAKNALESAEKELALKKAGATAEQIAVQNTVITQAEATVQTYGAQVKQAQATVARIQAELGKTVIRSPFEGTITAAPSPVGAIVAAYTPVVSMISSDPFDIEAYIPEADMAKVRVGNAVAMTFDAYGDAEEFHGAVIAIDPAETVIDGVTTYKTTIQLATNDDRVKSGMTVDVTIIGASKKDVVAIPQRAVISKDGKQIVRVIETPNQKEEIVEKEVTLGLRGADGFVEIVDGVEEGEKVVVFVEENKRSKIES